MPREHEAPDESDPEATQSLPLADGTEGDGSDDPDRSPSDDDVTQAVATSAPHEAEDPDATQAMPIASGDDDAAVVGAGEAGDGDAAVHEADGDEHTQVIERPADAEPHKPSFGGVYAAPPPSVRHSDEPPPSSPTTPLGAPPSARPPAKTAAPSGGRRRRRNWWLRGALVVIVAWLIFLIAVPIWAWQHIGKVDAEPGGDRPGRHPGDDLPARRLRQPRGPDQGAARRSRHGEGLGAAHRHDHPAARPRRRRPAPAALDPARLVRGRSRVTA